MRNVPAVIILSLAILLVASKARATNGTCEELKLDLPPIYDALQARLRQHMFTRDNNLKITVEQDTAAFQRFTDIADHYDKLMVNAIRYYNDGDPEAERLCKGYVFKANCEAYQVYLDTVINLPGIDREAVIREGERRCARARRASYTPIEGGR
ncbi:MAG: hypothetical protein NVV74_07685 [Magnetospirillum sp.]|nr:hypothetical protein [Magnetospirillum sp.]